MSHFYHVIECRRPDEDSDESTYRAYYPSTRYTKAEALDDAEQYCCLPGQEAIYIKDEMA